MNTDTFISALAILVIGYIIYKSFFADKETVLETINETKKEVETVVVKPEAEVPVTVSAPDTSKIDAVKLSDIVTNKKVTKRTKKPAAEPKAKKPAVPKTKTTKVNKNG